MKPSSLPVLALVGLLTASLGLTSIAQAQAPAAKPAPPAAKPAAKPATKPVKPPYYDKVKDSIDWGLKWLRTQQEKDGSFGKHPGLTAMVLQAFMQSPRKYREYDGPFIRKGVEYLVKLAKPNGAIFDSNLPTYNTALAIMALRAAENPAYEGLIEDGQRYLVGLQTANAAKHKESDPLYGGVGYGDGKADKADLSNLTLALEALAETGYDGDKAVFERAVRFVSRCQNRSESNDQKWAADDGGFVYAPGESKAGGTTSYGAMTYAGLASLMYAKVDREDPRVASAVGWAKAHWDVSQHPGMGDTGLFYYYQTLGKALAAYGKPKLVDSRGKEHDWGAELVEELIKRQAPEGYWVNTDPKYWEGNKILATARAILALEAALAGAMK